MPLPPKIVNAPTLKLGLELFITGFYDLSTCRSYGFGEGPIPWTAIQRYCEVNEITGVQREDFIYFMGFLDAAYLKFKLKKAETTK